MAPERRPSAKNQYIMIVSTLARARPGRSRWFAMLGACGRFAPSAWLLVLLSAGLQVVIFPLPESGTWLSWIARGAAAGRAAAGAPPETLQLTEGVKLAAGHAMAGIPAGLRSAAFSGTPAPATGFSTPCTAMAGCRLPAALGMLISVLPVPGALPRPVRAAAGQSAGQARPVANGRSCCSRRCLGGGGTGAHPDHGGFPGNCWAIAQVGNIRADADCHRSPACTGCRLKSCW